MSPHPSSPAARRTDVDWWRDAVFYQVYIRSFADGNGDGVGDLAGIRARLPHLAALGVDALWITPFYPSPMADHGYDVADPRDVEPVFGAVAGAVGCLAAMEVIKLITGIGEPLAGRLLTFDLRDVRFRTYRVARRADCAVCGGK